LKDIAKPRARRGANGPAAVRQLADEAIDLAQGAIDGGGMYEESD